VTSGTGPFRARRVEERRVDAWAQREILQTGILAVLQASAALGFIRFFGVVPEFGAEEVGFFIKREFFHGIDFINLRGVF
jgi:hypothetical protein